jgi:hypothetical protein
VRWAWLAAALTLLAAPAAAADLAAIRAGHAFVDLTGSRDRGPDGRLWLLGKPIYLNPAR